jgi:sec-independent protein translocase protein TatA
MGKLFDNPTVLIILILAVVLIFGSKRLPDAARGVGRSLRILKAETKGLMTDDDETAAAPVAQPQPVQQVQQVPAPAPQPVQAPAPPAAAPVAQPQPVQQPVVQPQAPDQQQG